MPQETMPDEPFRLSILKGCVLDNAYTPKGFKDIENYATSAISSIYYSATYNGIIGCLSSPQALLITEASSPDFNDELGSFRFVPLKVSNSSKGNMDIVKVNGGNSFILLHDGTLFSFNPFLSEVSKDISFASLKATTIAKEIASICAFRGYHNGKKMGFLASKKKSLLLYAVNEVDKVSLVEEIPIGEGVLKMCHYSNVVCFANEAEYKILNLSSKDVVPIFPYDRKMGNPIIVLIDRQDFLLVAASTEGKSLGIFVTLKGDPSRGTIEWVGYPLSVVSSTSYIVALLPDKIQINSAGELNLVQVIPSPMQFPSGLCNLSEEKLAVLYCQSVFLLSPTPLDERIHNLFRLGEVDFGIQLLESKDFEKFMTKNTQTDKKVELYKRASLCYLAQRDFEKFLLFSKKGFINPIILIKLSKSPYLSTIPVAQEGLSFDHEIDRVNESFKHITDLGELSRYIVEYCEFARSLPAFKEVIRIVDEFLLTMYVSTNDRIGILKIIKSKNCGFEFALELLHKSKLYYPEFIHAKLFDKHLVAFEVWRGVLEKESISDSGFGGLSAFVDYLLEFGNAKSLVKYLDWILSKDKDLGVKIATSSPDFDPAEVAPIIRRYGFSASISYLNFELQNFLEEKKSIGSIEYVCSKIAENYIADFLDNYDELQSKNYLSEYHNMKRKSDLTFLRFLGTNDDEISKKRSCFISHIKDFSKFLSPHDLLQQIDDFDGEKSLLLERALLLKCDNNPGAGLDILLNDLEDYNYAEQLCADLEDVTLKKNLYFKLFRFYVDRNVPLPKLRSFIERYAGSMDYIKVLECLPGSWSVTFVQEFLTKSFLNIKSRYDQSLVNLALATSYSAQKRIELMEGKRERIKTSGKTK